LTFKRLLFNFVIKPSGLYSNYKLTSKNYVCVRFPASTSKGNRFVGHDSWSLARVNHLDRILVCRQGTIGLIIQMFVRLLHVRTNFVHKYTVGDDNWSFPYCSTMRCDFYQTQCMYTLDWRRLNIRSDACLP
jgi:hypothetical protein